MTMALNSRPPIKSALFIRRGVGRGDREIVVTYRVFRKKILGF
jgi:hypothetical protein